MNDFVSLLVLIGTWRGSLWVDKLENPGHLRCELLLEREGLLAGTTRPTRLRALLPRPVLCPLWVAATLWQVKAPLLITKKEGVGQAAQHVDSSGCVV